MILVLLLALVGHGYSTFVPASSGEVWPKPLEEHPNNLSVVLHVHNLRFTVLQHSCDKVDLAIQRFENYLQLLRNITRKYLSPSEILERESVKNTSEFLVSLTQPCHDDEYPFLGMDESYTVQTTIVAGMVSGNSAWGLIRGFETMSHLCYLSEDYKDVLIKIVRINDRPNYLHRGLMLDTSRHYISLENILITLDAMAMNKLNVLHWHMADDESFPYVSKKFPELSAKGAYFRSLRYNISEMVMIRNFSSNLGIRVVVEFEMPGHTLSWGKSHPEILTDCGHLGPMNPIKNETYNLLRDFFSEVQKLFPDTYIHLGGDDIDKKCWANNEEIKKYMHDHNITDVNDLLRLFHNNTVNLLRNGSIPIVSQDIFESNVPLSSAAIIHVRRAKGADDAMVKVLNSGHLGLQSGGYNLDHLPWKNDDFDQFYSYEPRLRAKNVKQKERLENILGGEACLWGQKIDDSNLLSRSWPRASAVAEVLWSETQGSYPESAKPRIEEHICRMIRRGIPAEPANPAGFCVQ